METLEGGVVSGCEERKPGSQTDLRLSVLLLPSQLSELIKLQRLICKMEVVRVACRVSMRTNEQMYIELRPILDPHQVFSK